MLPGAAQAVTLPQEYLRQSVGDGSRQHTFFADRQFTPPSRWASARAGVKRKGASARSGRAVRGAFGRPLVLPQNLNLTSSLADSLRCHYACMPGASSIRPQ